MNTALVWTFWLSCGVFSIILAWMRNYENPESPRAKLLEEKIRNIEWNVGSAINVRLVVVVLGVIFDLVFGPLALALQLRSIILYGFHGLSPTDKADE